LTTPRKHPYTEYILYPPAFGDTGDIAYANAPVFPDYTIPM